MTKSVSTSKMLRKQYTSEFRDEALKLAERIGVAAAARELSLYESQLYTWRSKLKNALSSSVREQEMAVEIDKPESVFLAEFWQGEVKFIRQDGKIQ